MSFNPLGNTETVPTYVNQGSTETVLSSTETVPSQYRNSTENGTETVPSTRLPKEERKEEKKIYINNGIATDDQIQPLINALREVAKERYTNGRHAKFDDTALTIYADGGTPEQVLGFGEWWDRNCWYDPPGKAALRTILDEWQKYIDFPNSQSPNGNKTNGNLGALTGV
jgi:hypothetical protein